MIEAVLKSVFFVVVVDVINPVVSLYTYWELKAADNFAQ